MLAGEQPTNGPMSCSLDKLSGFSIDIIQQILEPFNLTYEITCYPENQVAAALQSLSDGVSVQFFPR